MDALVRARFTDAALGRSVGLLAGMTLHPRLRAVLARLLRACGMALSFGGPSVAQALRMLQSKRRCYPVDVTAARARLQAISPAPA